jgi:hypothetical protein
VSLEHKKELERNSKMSQLRVFLILRTQPLSCFCVIGCCLLSRLPGRANFHCRNGYLLSSCGRRLVLRCMCNCAREWVRVSVAARQYRVASCSPRDRLLGRPLLPGVSEDAAVYLRCGAWGSSPTVRRRPRSIRFTFVRRSYYERGPRHCTA